MLRLIVDNEEQDVFNYINKQRGALWGLVSTIVHNTGKWRSDVNLAVESSIKLKGLSKRDKQRLCAAKRIHASLHRTVYLELMYSKPRTMYELLSDRASGLTSYQKNLEKHRTKSVYFIKRK
jgi:hypothetical protein